MTGATELTEALRRGPPGIVRVDRPVRRVVAEAEFAGVLRLKLLGVQAGAVVGPGRSGAVASVYASHILGIPFIPYGVP